MALIATLAWNAPGYGDSQPLAVDWPDASDYAAALDRLLAHLDMSRCILVGHSLGTLIAARFALVSPRRVAALVLISPALGYGIEQGRSVAARGGGSARRARPAGRRQTSPPRERRACSPIRRRVPTSCRRSSAPWPVFAVPATTRPRACSPAGACSMTRRRIDVPTAVLVGAQDRITPPANARRVFDALHGPPQRHAYRGDRRMPGMRSARSSRPRSRAPSPNSSTSKASAHA